MKQLIIVLAAIASTLGAAAQKDFEGKVVYLMEADKDEKKPELTVWFAPNKLKISFKENEQPDNKYLLVWLDSGKIFTINTATQQYKTKLLKARQLGNFVSEKKNIMGYPTTSMLLESNSPGTGLGGILSMNDIVYHVADQLTYAVPDRYTGNPELMMVYQNRVALGASIKLSSLLYGMEEDSEGKVANITATAILVTPMALAPAEFEIPTGYRPQLRDEYAADSAVSVPDTVAMAVDSARAIPPFKKPAKKPVKKPTGKKTAVKSSAHRKQ
jgi:hypothetical protein